jgi:hypothetical protein
MQQPFYDLFVEIFKASEHRHLPDWVFANIEHGIELSSRTHAANTADLMMCSNGDATGWDAEYFINDRYLNQSFIGGATEMAWVLSHSDAVIEWMLPCLTKLEQVTQALDFWIGDVAFQLKTIRLGSSGIDIIVKDEYLITAADFLVLIEPTTALSYTMSVTQWELLKNDMCLWDPCEKLFWVRPKDFLEYGGVVNQLPEFVKWVRPLKT